MGMVLGLAAKLYRLKTTPSAAWQLMTNVQDVQVDLDKDTTDVTVRGGNGWKQTAATLKSAKVNFKVIYDTDSEDYQVLLDSYLNNTVIKVAVMDGAIDAAAGASEGLVAPMMVTKFSMDQALTEAIKVDVSIEPTYGSTPPDWKQSPVTAE